MIPNDPNEEMLRRLALSPDALQQPDIIGQILASYNNTGDPQAQGYDPKYVSGLVNTPLEFTPPAEPLPEELQALADRTVHRMPPKPAVVQPSGTAGAQNATNSPTNTTQPPINQPIQGGAQSSPNGIEQYMQIFKNTLPNEPKLDESKRKQLATVALINALGQALKQVVDFHGASKHGAPINPQVDQATPILLNQYNQEDKDYQQRKDRYDLMKTQTMQQALQYAYGDEKQRQEYEKQLALMNKQQEFSSAQTDKEIAAREKLSGQQYNQQTSRDATQYQQDLDKMKKNFGYESVLIDKRNEQALAALRERYGMQQAAKTAAALAKKSVQVVDEDPNKPVTIPPQIYMDILQKQTAIQNIDFAEFLNATDFNVQNNAGDIMVARYWKDFYQPVYDAQGNVASWEAKGVKYETAPSAGPTWFQPDSTTTK